MMKVSNKLNRVAALIAAAAILITLLISIITSVVNAFRLTDMAGVMYVIRTLLSLALSTISSGLLIAVLVRGKKDKIAAIMICVTILQSILSGVFGNIFSIISYMTAGLGNRYVLWLALGRLVAVCAAVVAILFRGMMAFECFKPGKLTTGNLRWAFVAVPVVCIILNLATTLVSQMYMIVHGLATTYLISTLTSMIFQAILSVDTILTGVAFAIPVYEKELPECEDCQQAEEATEEVTEAE